MSDVVAFVLARIAEDEARAHAAEGAPWTSAEGYRNGRRLLDVAGQPVFVYDDGWGIDTFALDVDVEHIAAWDPRRALAECAAKRTIVARVQAWRHDRIHGDPFYSCPATVNEPVPDDLTGYAREAWRDGDNPATEEYGDACECGLEKRKLLILQPLAQPYANHPDFDPAWKVTE